MTNLTKAQFLKTVNTHQMHIKHSNGVYRHLLFKKPDSSDQWFEIITWPHGLTISGDMGCWTFSRIHDMFDFFHSDNTLGINPSYWGEKLQSTSVYGKGPKEFNQDEFARQLRIVFDAIVHESDEFEDKSDEIWEEIQLNVLNHETEFELVSAAANFEYEGLTFEMFDVYNIGHQYSYHYIWCLFAIVWGISQYRQTLQAVG